MVRALCHFCVLSVQHDASRMCIQERCMRNLWEASFGHHWLRDVVQVADSTDRHRQVTTQHRGVISATGMDLVDVYSDELYVMYFNIFPLLSDTAPYPSLCPPVLRRSIKHIHPTHIHRVRLSSPAAVVPNCRL